MSQKAVWVRRAPEATAEPAVPDAGLPAPRVDVRRLRFSAEIESRIEHLPPFPTVLSELIGLTNSEDSGAGDLRLCLEKDPVLTARLLRLANSAFYSSRVPVTSVQQAIVMLGHNTVRSLGMAAATLKFLGRGADVYGMTAGGLWMHSYASAELARHLARAAEFPEDTQDALYVGALLHDIGKIVLVDFLTSLAAATYAGKSAETVGEWEARLTGFTHFGVGERIAEKWRLAPLTTGCIRYHHLADEVPEGYEREVVLVSLADVAARRLGIGVREPEESPEREGLLLERLGLADDRFRNVLETCSDIAGGAETMFSSLGGAK